MALIVNKKEFENLETENFALKEKITILETRLSVKDKALTEYRLKIEALQTEIDVLEVELEKRSRDNLEQSFLHQLGELKAKHSTETATLHQKICDLQIHPHNERGAGRKEKATPERKELIIKLFSKGISQNKIARILTEQSGEKWNKTTVRNIIIAKQNASQTD